MHNVSQSALFEDAVAQCESQILACDRQIAHDLERVALIRWSREVHAKRLGELKACQTIADSLVAAQQKTDQLEQQLHDTIIRIGGVSL